MKHTPSTTGEYIYIEHRVDGVVTNWAEYKVTEGQSIHVIERKINEFLYEEDEIDEERSQLYSDSFDELFSIRSK